MRGQPVQLLADVRLGGKHHRLLVKPGLVETPDLAKLRHRIAQPFLHRLRLPSRTNVGRLGQSCDFVQSLGEKGGERGSLLPPHGAELRQGLVERAEHFRLRRGEGGLVFLGLLRLDDAAQPKQPVERRRRYIFRPRQRGDGLHEMGEQFAVDPRGHNGAIPRHRQIGVAGAACNHFGDRRADRRVQHVEPRRQAQAEVEPLGIDGLDLPVPMERSGKAGLAGETGHAGNIHGDPESPRRCFTAATAGLSQQRLKIQPGFGRENIEGCVPSEMAANSRRWRPAPSEFSGPRSWGC